MGRYRRTGLSHGTCGSPQRSLENDELEAKVRILEERISLEKIEREREQLEWGIRELEKAGVRFTREDVVFVTRDQTGQLIWLEKGNQISGLEHILKHSNDFVKEHKTDSNALIKHIKDIISFGKVEYSEITVREGRLGFEKMYSYKGKYYMIGAIGLNGFVVSVYPINLKSAKERIKKNRK